MTMYQFFYLPLQKIVKEPNAFVTEDQVKLLFGNLQALMDQAKRMNTMLAKVVAAYTPHSKLGQIFTENAEQLKATFTPYVDPFDEANALFLTLRKDNEKFREWLQAIEFKTVDLGLESYLIMPIQRVTRYGLLLRELIHQTWQDHDDYEQLQDALKAVEAVASHVNNHKKKVIMQQKIKSILASVVGLPEIAANDERSYITEGAVTDLGDSIPVTHYIYLFSDLMIWTQMINKKKFMFRKMNWLKDSTAEAVEKSNSFRVITHQWTTTVFTKTKEDQNKWLAYLENENFTPNAEEPAPKRPEVVFLSKQKMVEDSLKRGLRRRNAGSQLKTAKGSSRTGSVRGKKDVGSNTSTNNTNNGTGASGGSGDEGRSTERRKDKTRKIPMGYATIDPKMLEQVKAIAKKEHRLSTGSDSKDTTSATAAPATTATATAGGRDSPTGSQKSVKDRDPLKSLTRKPKGSKKGDTITPELLEALRQTKNMTEEEQVAYLAHLQKEGHSSLPPTTLPSTSTSSSSSDPIASASSSTESAHENSNPESAARRSLSPYGKSMTLSVSSGSSKSWEGPPPPIPDVSHVTKRVASISPSSSTTSTSAVPGTRIRTSTLLSSGSHTHPAALESNDFKPKPRGNSIGGTPAPRAGSVPYASSSDSSSNPIAPDAPASSSSPSTTPPPQLEDKPSPTPSRPTRQVPVAKRSSTESLTDAAKRRSGSVNVSSRTSIM